MGRCVTDIGHRMSANRLKLNGEKTAALDRYKTQSVTVLDGCGPCLRLAASEHVPVLDFSVSPSRPTCVSLSTSATFAQRDFSGFDSFVASDDHLTLNRLRHSSMLSCRPAWITVMHLRWGAEEYNRQAAFPLQRVLNAVARVVAWSVIRGNLIMVSHD